MSWQTAFTHGYGPDKHYALTVIAKRTYKLQQDTLTIATQQNQLHFAEVAADQQNPLYSELVSEPDVLAYKPFTDVVVLAHASAPRGKKAYHLDCSVSIGRHQKTIRAFGNRKIEKSLVRGLSFTDPIPFESMPTGFSHAYGGRAASKDGTLYSYPRNFLGKGFTLKGSFTNYEEIAVANLEDPQYPVEPEKVICDSFIDWKNAPHPVSFGWSRQSFFPRYTFAGILPELPGALQSQVQNPQQAYVPDPRFFQGGCPELCCSVLYGGEEVRLIYLDPDTPELTFALPDEKPEMALKINQQTKLLQPVLHTVLIDVINKSVDLVWRGSYLTAESIDFESTIYTPIVA